MVWLLSGHRLTLSSASQRCDNRGAGNEKLLVKVLGGDVWKRSRSEFLATSTFSKYAATEIRSSLLIEWRIIYACLRKRISYDQ